MPRKYLWPLIVLTAIALASAAILVLSPPSGPAELRENTWRLIRYRDASGSERPVMPASKAQLTFERSRVVGSGGQNDFEARYTASEGTIDIGPLSATDTQGFGAVMRQERALFGALEAAARYQVADGQLRLFDSDGQVLLVFTIAQNDQSAEE